MASAASPPKKAALDLAAVRACAAGRCLSDVLWLPGRGVGCTQRERTPFTARRPIFLSPTAAIALYLHLHVHLRLLLASRCGRKQILAAHTHPHTPSLTHTGEVSLRAGCAHQG